MSNRGLAIYFYDERIRIAEKTFEDLRYPRYIHLFINEKEKQLYIRAAEMRDNDTFRVSVSKRGGEYRYRISSKRFVKYLAAVVGVPFPSDSLWFEEGTLLPDGKTVRIDLTHYNVTEYKAE
jgi:hypothetical protein